MHHRLRRTPVGPAGNNVSRSYLRRLTIPLAPGAPSQLPMATPLVPDEASYGHSCEFPAMNKERKGKEYRCAGAWAAPVLVAGLPLYWKLPKACAS